MPITNFPRSRGIVDDDGVNAPPPFATSFGDQSNIVTLTTANQTITNHVWQIAITGFASGESYNLRELDKLRQISPTITYAAHNSDENTSGSVRYALKTLMGSGNYSTNLSTSTLTGSSVTYTITNTGTRAGQFFSANPVETDVAGTLSVTITNPTNGATTTGGTWTVPAGVTRLKEVFLIGGGGGGGGGAHNQSAASSSQVGGYGGGGGGAAYASNLTVTPGENIAYVVGIGGKGGWGESDLYYGGTPQNGRSGTESSLTATAWALTAAGGNNGTAPTTSLPANVNAPNPAGTSTNLGSIDAITSSFFSTNTFVATPYAGGAGGRGPYTNSNSTWTSTGVAPGSGSSVTRSIAPAATAGSSGGTASTTYTLVNEIQTATVTGFASSDVFTISFTKPDTTVATSANVTVTGYAGTGTGSLKAALDATVASGNYTLTITETLGSVTAGQMKFTVEFIGAYATSDVSLLTAPTQTGCVVTITTTTPPWTLTSTRNATSSAGTSTAGILGGGGAGGAAADNATTTPSVQGGLSATGGGGGGGASCTVIGTTGATTTSIAGDGGNAASNSGAGGGGGGAVYTNQNFSTNYVAGSGGNGGDGFIVIVY